jgi:drug/metabolite transporter (DMT)-like permease
MNASLKPYGPYLIFAAAILWASDAPFRVHLTQALSSELIVLLEHAVALIILAPLLYVYRNEIRALTTKQWAAVLFIGAGGSALALVLFTESFNYMNPSVVILLQKLQPLIAIFLAVSFLNEATSRKFWLWGSVALFSAYVISFPNLIPQVYEGETFNPHIIGMLLAISAAVLWGTSTVLGRYMLDSVSFKTVTVLRFFVAVLVLLGFNYATGSLSEVSVMTAKDWLYIFIIAMTSGVAAMYIYYKGLSHSRASVATLAELGFPVGAVLVNYVFLDAALAPMQLLGVVGLVTAVYYLGKVNQT